MMTREQPAGAAELVLQGGVVFDSLALRFERADVAIGGGRILAIGENLATDAGSRIIALDGGLVCPGLIDMHSHVFSGQDLGRNADDVGPPAGVTTFVDAGSAGAHLWGAMWSEIRARRARILPFINISSVGTTSILLRGELRTLPYINGAACVAAASTPGARAVGVKIRASQDVAGANANRALRIARAAADELGLPLMVHLGPRPVDSERILATLRGGDVLTHCFTSFRDNGVVRDGKVLPAAVAARERGVLFDVGHGMAGLDLLTARAALELGFPPDTISSDLHSYSVNEAVGLPTVLTRFVSLGMSLEEVLHRATAAPARFLGLLEDGIGHLRAGGVADIAVLRLAERSHRWVDRNGEVLEGTQSLVVGQTIQGGEVVFNAAQVAKTRRRSP